jgi:hypothetical protein
MDRFSLIRKRFFQKEGKLVVEIGSPPERPDENTMHIFYISTFMGTLSFENYSFSLNMHWITHSMHVISLASSLLEPPSTCTMS